MTGAGRLQATGSTSKTNWVGAGSGGGPGSGCYITCGSCVSASWDTAVVTQVTNPELTQLTLVDLRPARAYNLRVFATNSVGTSPSSNVLTVITKEAGRVVSPGGGQVEPRSRTQVHRAGCVSSAPEGPPVDMLLEGLTARSIRVTWKVGRTLPTSSRAFPNPASSHGALSVVLPAPQVRAHQRRPPRLRHQLQGVRPRRKALWEVAPPERERHPGGGERRPGRPQALHQLRRAGPGKNQRGGGARCHGAALPHPGRA